MFHAWATLIFVISYKTSSAIALWPVRCTPFLVNILPFLICDWESYSVDATAIKLVHSFKLLDFKRLGT